MSTQPQTSRAMDDLEGTAARFEEDVTRIHTFTNGDEEATYTTVDGRVIPSLTRIIANVEEMVRPDVEAITQGAVDATDAASRAQASASSAAQDAQSSSASAELVESYATTVAAEAANAIDASQRAEYASYAAGAARDAAVGAQQNVQQNADAAGTAAANAQEAERAAFESASAAARDAAQTSQDVQSASLHAGDAAASAVMARDSETRAIEGAEQSEQSAAASAASAVDSRNYAAAINPDLFVRRGGDAMTGQLNMRNANVMFQNSAAVAFGFLGAYGVAGAAGTNSGMGFVDSTLVFWNFQVDNGGNTWTRGTADVRGGVNVWGGRLNLRQNGGAANGEIALFSSDGTTMFMRGRGAGGGMEWINHSYDNICGSMDNNGLLRIASALQVGNGSAQLGGDGNIIGGLFPQGLHGWVHDVVTDRAAPRGAWCNHAVAAWESGWLDTGGAGGAVVHGSPHVICGMAMEWTTMRVWITVLQNV